MKPKLPENLLSKLKELKLSPTPFVLVVRIPDQTLTLFKEGRSTVSCAISTSKRGAGQRENSFQTPLGLHRIAEKIGASESPYAIFRSRKKTGEIWSPATKDLVNEDLILSRILRLEGLEEGFNRGKDSEGRLVDSFSRYIYIHGTNHENELGKPRSHGCIRMSTPDILELFEKVPEGSLVWIADDS
jgi:UDP-N-acetylmuramate--alanine ligase